MSTVQIQMAICQALHVFITIFSHIGNLWVKFQAICFGDEQFLGLEELSGSPKKLLGIMQGGLQNATAATVIS